MKMKRIISILICLLASVVGIFASDLIGSQSIQNSLIVSATPLPSATPPVSDVPDDLKDQKTIQLILARLEKETARADLAEKLAKDTAANRDEWRGIADKEKLRADQLNEALQSKKEEAVELRMSKSFLITSLEEYKEETKSLRSEVQKLRSRQKILFGTGVVVGAAVSYGIYK